ncbi:universal stress protein [Streptomyces sp. NPDC086777]|uniref:universal stress protein n=1 Tax=Streptomyces sp. NPDC086777 TaxID=3154866 RepID=UPI00344FE532
MSESHPSSTARLVVGVSGSPGSVTALVRAADEARRRGAELWPVHARVPRWRPRTTGTFCGCGWTPRVSSGSSTLCRPAPERLRTWSRPAHPAAVSVAREPSVRRAPW